MSLLTVNAIGVSEYEAPIQTTSLLTVRAFGTGGGNGGGGGNDLLYTSKFTNLPSNGEVLHPDLYSIGDLLLFCYGGRSGGGVTFVDYTPTLIDGQAASGVSEAFAYYRTAADVVVSETVTYGFARAKGWYVLQFSNAAFNVGLDAATNGTTHTCPDVTTTVDGCRIFRFMGCRNNFGGITGTPAGTIVEGAVQVITDGNVCLVDEGIQASAGATGTADFTTGLSGIGVVLTIAIAPV